MMKITTVGSSVFLEIRLVCFLTAFFISFVFYGLVIEGFTNFSSITIMMILAIAIALGLIWIKLYIQFKKDRTKLGITSTTSGYRILAEGILEVVSFLIYLIFSF